MRRKSAHFRSRSSLGFVLSEENKIKAWGHTAHRGWARLLLDRARDLIIHGPAHRGANGAAMPTDEDDQDGHFFYNHPDRGVYGLLRRLGARSPCYCCLDQIHPLRGGAKSCLTLISIMWHFARAVGKRFRGCHAKRLYVYLLLHPNPAVINPCLIPQYRL